PPWEFRISADTNPGQTPPANSVTPTQIIVHPDSSVDLALVRVPPGLGTRTILSNRDSIWHDTVLALGYGQNSTTGGGKGTLRYGQLNGFTLANGQIQLDKNWRDQLTDHGD